MAPPRHSILRLTRIANGRRATLTVERATWMTLEAIQVLGGSGYINDYPTNRPLRDTELYESGVGTSEIRRMMIGQELFRGTG